jgi:hypothetical protein
MCCINAKIPPQEKSEILSNLKKGGTKGACVKAYSSVKHRVYYRRCDSKKCILGCMGNIKIEEHYNIGL